MAFDVICKNCGAPSGQSVGTCPFCKTTMVSVSGKYSESFEALSQSYSSGNMDLAILQVNKIIEDRKTLIKDVALTLLTVKILLETEAPRTRISNLLAEALLEHPLNEELQLYFRIAEAKNNLKVQKKDAAELILLEVLKKNPHNVHANFIIGTHLFWDENNPKEALIYIDLCVRQHPKFKRAWGCLGAIYEKLGNKVLSNQAYLKFRELESNLVVKAMLKKDAA